MGDRSLDDEDFGYQPQEDVEYSDGGEQFQETAKSHVVQNQPHDEEVALSDTESFTGRDEPPAATRGVDRAYDASLIESHDDDGPDRLSSPGAGGGSGRYGGYQKEEPTYDKAPPAHLGKMEDRSSPTDMGDAPSADGYNAMDYKHLAVSDEIRDLFKHIGRYKPHEIPLETKLKPFIPDYIPAVGGIDEFIKVPRPDAKPDYLGLKVLDEPSARQSDPTVLTLQLRTLSKEAPGNKAEMIGRIEHTDENKMKKISGWISSVQDLHKQKPVSTVSYSRRMPDIEALMQEWPPELEQFLKTMKLPSGELDVDLKTYVKLVCGILDIPVYDNPVESLHVLFTLYLEFKSNPVFKQQMDMESKLGTMEDGMSTLREAPSWTAGVSSPGASMIGQAPW